MCANQLSSSQRVFISGYFESGSEAKEEKSKKSAREGGRDGRQYAECFPRSAAGTQGIVCPHVIMPMGNAVAEK